MRMEFSFHPLEGWPGRHRVDCVGGEIPQIWLLMPTKLEPSWTRSADGDLRLRHIGLVSDGERRERSFFKKTFVWCRPSSFDGERLTCAFYAPTEIRFFEGLDSADADARAQEYIRGRMEGTLWPRI